MAIGADVHSIFFCGAAAPMLPWICSFSLALAWKVAMRCSPIERSLARDESGRGVNRIWKLPVQDFDVCTFDQAASDQVARRLSPCP